MSLFKQQPHDEWRVQRSQEQLAQGGLPLNAEFRLRNLQGGRPFFTSDLSINELVLTASEGIRPLGQVTGSSIFHVGWQPTPVYGSMELVVLSEARHQAFRLAVMRLQKEAQALGAHGIIGVRLTQSAYDWGEGLLEFSLIGTAIRWDGAKVPTLPFVCDLSGQEFWALLGAGYLPAGLAYGTCVYYQVATFNTQWATQGNLWGGTGAYNQELTDYTAGYYQARHTAMSRLSDDAMRDTGMTAVVGQTWQRFRDPQAPQENYVADAGVIGVTVEKDIHFHEVEQEDYNGNKQHRRDMIVQFTAIGTAVRQYQQRDNTIEYALPLDG